MVNQFLTTVWKQLNFFYLLPCTNHNNKLKNIKNEIICQCYNEENIVLCDAKIVHIFSNDWKCYTYFHMPHAHANANAVELCALSEENNTLITLTRVGSSEILIQLFQLNKIVKYSEAAQSCLGMAKLKTINKPTTIKLSYIDNSLIIAIGFNYGDLLLYRGPLVRDMSANFRSLSVSTSAITGIEFSQQKQQQQQQRNMFVCSDSGVVCYTLADNVICNESKIILDKAATTCCVLHQIQSGNYFVAGQKGAIYYFSSDDRGPCFVMAGTKRILTAFHNYLIVVIEQQKTSFTKKATSQLIIIDIENNLIVLNLETESIINIIKVNNKCYVLTISKQLYLLCEKDINTKIRLLLHKHLYDKAIRLLHNAVDDENDEMLANINLEYGDYLLTKSDINAATDKYIKTLGIIDPYCVIERLLDSKNNKYLTIYLHALVQSKFANAEHKEMYLNCNDRCELSANIEQLCCCSANDNDANVWAASSITRSTSTSHKNLQLNNLISMAADAQQLRQFFSKMNENDIYEYFINNAEMLTNTDAHSVTEILKKLCCSAADNCLANNIIIQTPERFLPLLLQDTDCCIDFLEHIVRSNKNCHVSIYATLFEYYLRQWQLEKRTEKELSTFLTKYYDFMCAEQMLILCKNYCFWLGIVHIYENYMQNQLYVQYFLKNCTLQNSTLIQPEHCIDLHMWLNTINTKEEATLTTNQHKSLKFIYNLLNAILKENKQSILQVLQTLSGNKHLLVLHIKEFFTQEHLQKVAVSNQQNQIANSLRNDLCHIDKALKNFSKNPIEFRNSICDYCRKQLKLPAIYYMCQHSYHKECVPAASSCILCKTNEISSPVYSNFAENLNCSQHATNAIMNASISLGLGRFQIIDHSIEAEPEKTSSSHLNLTKTANSSWPGRFLEKNDSNMKQTNIKQDNVIAAVTKKKYDANLNPFEI